MSNINLTWASAEVQDGTLTVALDGELPKDWKRSFERTVALLGDGEWGEVKLKKGAVKVSQVSPGSEEKLRHHLESIVTQANAAIDPDDDEADVDEDAEPAEEEEPEGPDAEMTERFRAFAEPPREGGA